MRFAKHAALVATMFVASTGSAATYYVATTGSDSNPGTLAAPLRTITRSASVAKPGDTVEVRGGVYNEIVNLYAAKGTAAARIIIRNYAGETPVVDGTGMAANTDLVRLSTSQYADFVGFEVRNSTGLGITVWNAKNVRVANNKVHHSTRGGIYVGCDTVGGTSDIVIEGNDVYNNVLDNQYHTKTSGWSQAIGINEAARVTVANNRVHENDGEGIAFVGADHVVARNNTVFDNYSINIYFDNAQFCTADSNFVYSTATTRYNRFGFPAAGIGFANEVYSILNPLTDNKVTNNIVVNTRWSLYYGGFQVGGGLKNTTISNNTFYKASTAILSIDADSHTGNLIQNNIFAQSGGGLMMAGVATGTQFRTNLWYGGNAGVAAGSGDLVGDPLFANAGGLNPNDYKVKAISPAVHTATDTNVVAADFFGAARTPSYDMGAHEQSLPLGSGAAASGPSIDPPSALRASVVSATSVTLIWTGNAASYRVYRDGARIGAVSANTITDKLALPQTKYTYEVSAIDAGGQETLKSVITVTTPVADLVKPTDPTALVAQPITATSATTNSVTLTWTASTDNVQVTGYKIYRDNAHVATSTITEFGDQGLGATATHTYYVVAMDAAGNVSGKSNTVTVTTQNSKRRASK
jgi:parallel beta-helix repeat protein